MIIKWKTSVCKSLEASIVRMGFPGLSDRYTATILVNDDGTAMGYVNGLGRTIWANRNFKSVRSAKSFMSKMLKREAGA